MKNVTLKLVPAPLYIFLNWDSLHARLNSHYKAWSYNEKKQKKKKLNCKIELHLDCVFKCQQERCFGPCYHRTLNLEIIRHTEVIIGY